MREEEKSTSGNARKRLASKAAYAKSKTEYEHALLRLRPGSLARLDAARTPLGLSRSAYIDALLDASAQSTFSPKVASGIDHPSRSIGDEFEALFGG
ncbi:hypothetical protein ABIB42_002254 [Massilia sp. UYP32]|uniref:hypothetical protein n=1 Tax=Massilia sp. UYP32 TaxID=1756386 RepID=UPI003D254323